MSYEPIYRTLFVQIRGALKRELLEHLRRTGGMRRSRHYSQRNPIHGRIVYAVPISERLAYIEHRAVSAHWEGDLLFGEAYSQIATLVERHTRYVRLVKLVEKDSYTVGAALVRHAQIAQAAVSLLYLGPRKRNGLAQTVRQTYSLETRGHTGPRETT